MASKSSRRRKGSRSRAEDLARLLKDGAAFEEPPPVVRDAAAVLRGAGLVEATFRHYVRCADPEDGDFPPKNRHCRGRVYVGDGLDEPGHDYRCQECERPVLPGRFKKRRHEELQVRVLAEGVKSYVQSELARFEADVKELADGTYRVDLGDLGVVICILDYCDDERFRTLDWAKTQPTCYLVVNADHAAERLQHQEWLTSVSLADLVAKRASLGDIVQGLATAGPPSEVKDVPVPVYSKSMPVTASERPEGKAVCRRFIVEVGPRTVRIDGEDVVAPQSGTRLEVFRILWERYLDDMKSGRSPEESTLLRISDIVDLLQERSKEYVEDLGSVRRTVNRLQAGIEKAYKKKVGAPIGRNDVIESVPWAGYEGGEHGYRINPRTICARPFQMPSA